VIKKSWLPLVVVTCALQLSSPACAEERTESRYSVEYFGVRDADRDLFLCILLPYQRCQRTIDSAIGYGGGLANGTHLETLEENNYMQFYIDASYLIRVVERPSLQLGPSIGFEVELFDQSLRYHLFSTVRARLWAGRWVNFDFALGAVGSFDRSWRFQGAGGLAEISLSAHAHLGAFVQTQVTSGPLGPEVRVSGGFRGSFTAWAVIFAGMAG